MQFKSLFPGRRQYVHQVHYLEWIFKISKQDCKGKRLSTQKPEKEDAVSICLHAIASTKPEEWLAGGWVEKHMYPSSTGPSITNTQQSAPWSTAPVDSRILDSPTRQWIRRSRDEGAIILRIVQPQTISADLIQMELLLWHIAWRNDATAHQSCDGTSILRQLSPSLP